ncbi:MAG: FG-GAP-like repeat-containing protein [Chitinophagales bacterium]
MKPYLLFASCMLFYWNLVSAQSFIDVAGSQSMLPSSVSPDNYGNGINFFDFNQDGWDDLSLAMQGDTQVFYINDQGNLIRSNFGIYHPRNVKQLLWLDYDNDQDMDLVMSVKEDRCYLYQNDGNFNFTDVTSTAGLYTGNASNYGVSAADINKDGYLDILVCRYNIDPSEISPYNKLYLNDGDGTFTDISVQAGFHNEMMLSFLGVFLDYNMDSWPDIYVINDRSSGINKLYRNNGDLSFTEVGQNAGVGMNGEDPMTASVADFDNDNDLDIFTSNTSVYFAYMPKLFVNQGDSTFLEQANTYAVDVDNTSWGGLWLDYNNDGFQDLYVATAFLNVNLAPVRSYLLKNRFPQTFSDDSTLFIGNHNANSHAVARGDLDNNGFYDIAVSNKYPELPFLWQNTGGSNKFIKISIEGTLSNYQAIGSWIRVYAGNQQYNQYTMCGENYSGQNSQHYIFGLRNANMADSVIISYPSGIVDKYYNLNHGQHYYFVEGETYNFELNYTAATNDFCTGDTLVLQAPTNFEAYLWNTGDTTSSISVVGSGNYFLQAYDAEGFIHKSDTASFSFYDLPAIFYDLSQPSCAGTQDGSIQLIVNNQGQLYTVIWSEGTSGSFLDSLGFGEYYFSYVDEFQCSYSDSLLLEEPFPINVQILVTDQNNEDLGSIQLVVNGGTSPYEIYLDQVPQSNSIEDLLAGSYFLEIHDFNNCIYSDSIVIALIEDSLINSLSISKSASELRIYPNPTSSAFRVDTKLEIIKIELVSSLGEIIELKSHQSSYLLTNHVNGIYYLKIYLEDTFKICKLEFQTL